MRPGSGRPEPAENRREACPGSAVWLAAAMLFIPGIAPAHAKAPHPLVNEASAALKSHRGLVVWLGGGAGESAIELAKAVDCVLHGLEPDAAAAEKAGRAILEAGLCGRAWIESLAARLDPLPYNSWLANVVIIDDFARVKAAGLAPAEVARITAPAGLVVAGQDARTGKAPDPDAIKKWLAGQGLEHLRLVRREGVWQVFRKPVPPSTGQFSHKWKTPRRNLGSDDENIVIPDTLRWMTACPANGGQLRTAGRRVIMLHGKVPPGPDPETQLTSFDAFSGVRQWSSAFPAAKRPHLTWWIATDSSIVMLSGEELIGIDADTGKRRVVYEQCGDVEDILVEDGVLVCTEPFLVRGLDVGTGKLLWRLPSQSPPPEGLAPRKGPGLGGYLRKARNAGFETYCVVAAEGKAFILDYFLGADKKPRGKLLGVDLATGKVVWTNEDPLLGGGYRKYCYYAGQLIVSTPGALLGLPISGGGKRWKHDAQSWNPQTNAVSLNIGNGKSVFGAGGLVWFRNSETSRGRTVILDPPDKKQPFKTWIGLDPKTGREKTRIGYELEHGTWQQRCYPDSGTPNFIYSSNSEFIDTKNREFSSWRIMRGICGEGPIYGSGTMYIPPAHCYWCYPMVRGGLALGTAPDRRIAVADDRRLERGPAYGNPGPAPNVEPSDWPMFRHDMRRTGGTPVSVQWPLRPAKGWPKPFRTRVHAPLVVGNRLYVTCINEGRVVALDTGGRELWSYAAGSRIDLPPTLHGSLLLFGCHDGKVHAVRASDGACAWRLNVAPEVRRMVAADVVESPWPIMGSVLVIDGVAYVSAGRITGLDGGLCLCAFDAATGKLKWLRRVGPSFDEPRLRTGADNNPAGYWKKPIGPKEGQMTNSVLVYAGGDELRLYDQQFVWRFDRRNGEFILVATGTGYPHSDYSASLPWHGFGRLSQAGMLAGTAIHGEFLIRGGLVLSFPAPTAGGLTFASAQKVGYILLGSRPEGVRWVREYEDKAGGIEPAWGPITCELLVNGACAVGDKAFVTGQPMIQPPGWTPAVKPPKSYKDGKTVPTQVDAAAAPELRCLSLTDGKELGRLMLPAPACREGAMSFGRGRLYVALEDGQVLALEAAP